MNKLVLALSIVFVASASHSSSGRASRADAGGAVAARTDRAAALPAPAPRTDAVIVGDCSDGDWTVLLPADRYTVPRSRRRSALAQLAAPGVERRAHALADEAVQPRRRQPDARRDGGDLLVAAGQRLLHRGQSRARLLFAE